MKFQNQIHCGLDSLKHPEMRTAKHNYQGTSHEDHSVWNMASDALATLVAPQRLAKQNIKIPERPLPEESHLVVSRSKYFKPQGPKMLILAAMVTASILTPATTRLEVVNKLEHMRISIMHDPMGSPYTPYVLAFLAVPFVWSGIKALFGRSKGDE